MTAAVTHDTRRRASNARNRTVRCCPSGIVEKTRTTCPCDLVLLANRNIHFSGPVFVRYGLLLDSNIVFLFLSRVLGIFRARRYVRFDVK